MLLLCRSAANVIRAQAEAAQKAQAEQKVHDALKQKASAAARAKQARQAAYSTSTNPNTAKFGKGGQQDSRNLGSSTGSKGGSGIRKHVKEEERVPAAAVDETLTTAKAVTPGIAAPSSSLALDVAASKPVAAVLPATAGAAAKQSKNEQRKAEKARNKAQKKAALQLGSGVNVTTASVAQTAAHHGEGESEYCHQP